MTLFLEHNEYIDEKIRSSIFKNVFLWSFFILAIFIFSQYNELIGFVLSIPLILFMSLISIEKPKKAFFIILGIKFTYDILWMINLPGMEGFKMTHLIIIPLLLLTFSKIRPQYKANKLILLFIIYLTLVSLTPVWNGYGFEIEAFIRHAMPLFAFIFASKYLKNRKDIDFMVYALLLGSVLPLFALFGQFLFMLNGIEILYSKFDPMRGTRLSGFYYDAGTIGSIALMAMLGSIYVILKKGFELKGEKVIAYIIMFLAISVALLGETRSIVSISVILIGGLIIVKIKEFFKILVILLVTIIVFQQNLEYLWEKSRNDINFENMSVEEIFEDTANRTMLTGRVGIWQDIWDEFRRLSIEKQIFGSGKSTNAHSSYFYLLLKVGIVGLFFYLFVHFLILYKLIANNSLQKNFKMSGIAILIAILVLGLGLNVTLYTTYQLVLYSLVSSIMIIENKSVSEKKFLKTNRRF